MDIRQGECISLGSGRGRGDKRNEDQDGSTGKSLKKTLEGAKWLRGTEDLV